MTWFQMLLSCYYFPPSLSQIAIPKNTINIASITILKIENINTQAPIPQLSVFPLLSNLEQK